ncbi:aminoglycoside phosphotransferase family protein [Advenella sp. FME57]|uniref:aminoglycoside phosphotransferase family protein n=1 Tax=Advenella sp. FME57 TaxID=2742604 RepID=UPI001D0133F7|nr:aminoglycoside phosphotransferase family protein [Advenella sp. FME57]
MTDSMTDGNPGSVPARQEQRIQAPAQATTDVEMDVFAPWIKKWNLVQDGTPIATPGSSLLPVKMNNAMAMLKIARDEHEIRGGKVLQWWDGNGAARVFARNANALVLERAQGKQSLMQMALHGQDDNASRIACDTVAQLHAYARRIPGQPELVLLQLWFADLFAAARSNPVLQQCANAAQRLLADPEEITVLHGDIHHDNILDFADRGWLAIDPKGLLGERGFDYANLIVNPDLPTVTDPDRFARQVQVVSQAASLDRHRLLCWVLAFAGLSAVWFIQDASEAQAQQDLNVARLALQALSLSPN